MIQSHFSHRTKQFVNRKTIYNMKLHYLRDMMNTYIFKMAAYKSKMAD